MLIAAVLIVLAIFAAIALQVDDWSRDLSINRAATSAGASDPLLQSLELPFPPEKIREAITRFVEENAAWSLDEAASVEGDETSIRLVRTSRLFRFADDVQVFLQPTAIGTLVDVASQSRVGKGDLGQNPRNIRQLMQAIRTEFDTSN